MDQLISLFNGVTDTKGTTVSVRAVIDMIRTDSILEKDTNALRSASPEQKDALKKKLLAVTWSAQMDGQGRAGKNVLKYSGLMVLDIDKLSPDQLIEIWEKICADPFTFFAFISPSGNGIKVLVQVPLYSSGHQQYFKLIEKHYQEKNIAIDPSGKDINRLCFLAFDDECYFNETAITLELPDINSAPVPPAKMQVDPLQEAYQFTTNKLTYADGNRNNFIHLFAANCNRKGIDINDCLNYTLGFASDLNAKEVAATVDSAYKHNTSEAGKFARRSNGIASQQTTSSGQLPQRELQFVTIDKSFTQFWFEEKTTDRSGKEKTTLELSYRLLIQFLSEAGFHRLALSENSYELVHYSNNIVKRVQAYQVRDYVIKWAHEQNHWALEEKLRRAGKTALNNDQINTLPFIDIEFKRDTYNEAFFYFTNCWVRASATGITTHAYSELDKAIWATQIKARDFQKLDNWLINIDEPKTFTCEYARFLYLTSHNIKGDEKQDLILRLERFDSFCTAFGYLLHSFKNPGNAKMILSIDHKIGEKGEQNGGSGKSLAGKAVSFLKHITPISGKDFKEDYPFKYEQVTPDSQIVCFNDLRKNFNLETLFEVITGDWEVNRRNVGYNTIPFADSPKVYGNTNFIPGGEGSSFARRMHLIEFSDYFNDEHTPFDEFGHNLFDDWDNEEWNRFYNFMLQNCVSLFLQKGLVKYPGSNFDQRKLQNEVPEEFIDFLDQKDEGERYIIDRNVCHRKVDLLDLFKKYTQGTGLKDPTANSFTRWIKKYCKTKGYEWNKHAAGKRDSSGPLGEFVSICDNKFDHEICMASRGALFNKN